MVMSALLGDPPEKLTGRCPKGGSDADDILKTDVSLATLDGPDVCPVETRSLCELFLRKTEGYPKVTNSPAEKAR